MRSVDTNILARAILGDDTAQRDAAIIVLAEPVLVTVSVVVELVWLLGSRGQQNRAEIVANLGALLSVDHIHFAEQVSVRWALAKFANGADFADMIHLALSVGADTFVTFDQGVARYAGPDTPVPVETL